MGSLSWFGDNSIRFGYSDSYSLEVNKWQNCFSLKPSVNYIAFRQRLLNLTFKMAHMFVPEAQGMEMLQRPKKTRRVRGR